MKIVNSGLDFFYDYSEGREWLVYIGVTMKSAVDVDLFEQAVNRTLMVNPGFKVYPVFRDNNLYFEYNEKEFSVNRTGVERDLVKNTNGYLFDVKVTGNEVCFMVPHLLADGVGLIRMCSQVVADYIYHVNGDEEAGLYLEKQKRLREKEDETGRTISEKDREKWKQERANIYENVQEIPCDGEGEEYLSIEVDSAELSALAGELGVKPYVLVNVLLGNTVDRYLHGLQTERKKIYTYMSVDMRKRMGVQVLDGNYLSRILVEHPVAEFSQDLATQGKRFMENFKNALKNGQVWGNWEEEANLNRLLQNPRISLERKKNMLKNMYDKVETIYGTMFSSYLPMQDEQFFFRTCVDKLSVFPVGNNVRLACEMATCGLKTEIDVVYRPGMEQLIREFEKCLSGLFTQVETKKILPGKWTVDYNLS